MRQLDIKIHIGHYGLLLTRRERERERERERKSEKGRARKGDRGRKIQGKEAKEVVSKKLIKNELQKGGTDKREYTAGLGVDPSIPIKQKKMGQGPLHKCFFYSLFGDQFEKVRTVW